jgi:SAM-dependent methyltransferase
MDQHEVIARNRDSFDAYYAGLPRQRYPDLMFIHLLMVYARKLTDVRRALVIGAGDGAEAIAIARTGAQVVATDIAPNAVARMESHFAEDGVTGLCSARLADQTSLGNFDGSGFDLVVSWSVISYLLEADAERAVAEIFRVLRPGGTFVGLLESLDHSGPQQDGAEHLGPRTVRMPPTARTKADVVMTYYGEADVRRLLSAFELAALSHREIRLPPRADFRVGQWMFCCRKAL